MDAARKWTLWGTGVAGSFLVLEALALREEISEGKPSGTLTAVVRRGLGIDPAQPRRYATSAAFVGACAWLAGHVCLGWPPNNVPTFLRGRQPMTCGGGETGGA